MSLYDAGRILKPEYFRLAPLHRGRSTRRVHVVGFDTEAINGQPVTIQFSEAGGPEAAELILLPDRPYACLDEFMSFVNERCQSRVAEHLVVGFNLMYEWTQLFGDLPESVVAQHEFRVVWAADGADVWHVEAWNHQRHSARLFNVRTHVRVLVLDAAAFFPGSLDAVAQMVGLERKDPIDKQWLASMTRADLLDPVFQHYSKQDAVVTRLIGERIVEMHEEYDVATCRTAPQFASSVFRHRFLLSEVDLPTPALEQAGLLSYHGGKNGFYLRQPESFDAWNLDVVSAYPDAMHRLPAIEGSVWEPTTTYREGVHGLWLASFTHHPCRFNGALTHDGHRLPAGPQTVWLTSYELDAMRERDEARGLTVSDGWVMVGERTGGSLADFVDTFFEMKRTTKGPQRATAKLMLNSLSGKFFQKTALGDVGQLVADLDLETGRYLTVGEAQANPDLPYDYQAGGLYHPPVASLITGYVRAHIHRLEHKYWAVATSTDGLFARQAPWVSDLGDELGQLTAEHGRLDIWRERLYEFMPEGPVGKRKVALHGFRGSADDLRMIPLTPGVYEYTARHAMTLREAQQQHGGQRYRAGQFAALRFTLDLSV